MCQQIINPSSSATKNRILHPWLPTLRDKKHGWYHFAAVLYSLSTVLLGFMLMIRESEGEAFVVDNNNNDNNIDGALLSSFLSSSIPKLMVAIFLAAHGRIVASYLVHECAHSSVFVNPWANEWLGILCLWLSGSPYVDYRHIKKIHWHHHKDRADPYEWDFHPFLEKYPLLQTLVLWMECAFIPAVDTIAHLKTAMYPIFFYDEAAELKMMKEKSSSATLTAVITRRRHHSAMIGTTFQAALYACLFHYGALVPHFVAGALVLHFLSIHDAFQHTYEAYPMNEHTPGPNGRTAEYEEENTYSNLLSDRFEWLNLLALNFGYHNAHHKNSMMPWYALPAFHKELYSNDGSTDSSASASKGDKKQQQEESKQQPQQHQDKEHTPEQLLPMRELVYPWLMYRGRRVLQEDYGVVHPRDSQISKEGRRAHDFVGALGVSFLTS